VWYHVFFLLMLLRDHGERGYLSRYLSDHWWKNCHVVRLPGLSRLVFPSALLRRWASLLRASRCARVLLWVLRVIR
jgi:hypothetical protein